MPTVVAVMVLGRSALLCANWWVVRALNKGDGRDWDRLLWSALAVAVLASLADFAFGVGGRAAPGVLAEGFALSGTAALVMIDGGFTALAGLRAARAVPAARLLRRAAEQMAAGRLSAAAISYAGAADQYRRSGQHRLELDATDAQARCLLADGQSGLATVVYESAIERAQGLPTAVTRAELGAGDAAWCAGDIVRARRHYQAAASSAQASADGAAIVVALERLAWLEFLLGDVDLAGGYLAWATHAADPSRDLAAAASLMQLAACRAVASGHPEAARPAAEDALRVAPAAKNGSLEALGRLILGCVHYLEGWDDSGRQYIAQQAAGNFGQLERRRAAAVLIWISTVVRARGGQRDADGFAMLSSELRERRGTRAG
ncbi:MAG TPA: hypothetical protein VF134_08600 [Candidatus Dormibacteraeota bacterium]